MTYKQIVLTDETAHLLMEAVENSIELLCSKINDECSRVKYCGDFEKLNEYERKLNKFIKLYEDSNGEKDYYKLISDTFNKILAIKSLLNSLKDEDLWRANPNCEHIIVFGENGGVRCTKCRGWLCG